MNIWNDSILTNLAKQAEEHIAMVMPCIVDRISLSTTSGSSLIALPNYIIDIVSITWKGKQLSPYPINDYIEAGSAPMQVTSSIPLYYVYSGYGTNVIKLLPAPNETLAASSTPPYTKLEIGQRLVIEFKRIPDLTTNTQRIPIYFRRRLIKDWVCYRAFLQESQGTNIKASEYFNSKFKMNFDLAKEIYNKLFVSKRYEMQPQENSFAGGKPPRPVLPSQFGQVIRD